MCCFLVFGAHLTPGNITVSSTCQYKSAPGNVWKDLLPFAQPSQAGSSWTRTWLCMAYTYVAIFYYTNRNLLQSAYQHNVYRTLYATLYTRETFKFQVNHRYHCYSNAKFIYFLFLLLDTAGFSILNICNFFSKFLAGLAMCTKNAQRGQEVYSICPCRNPPYAWWQSIPEFCGLNAFNVSQKKKIG